MKGGTRAAVALGVGYVLGRRRKMRMATMLAVATAAGGVGSLGSAAAKRGAKALGSSDALGKVTPQLGGIVNTVRGELVDAGKAAAIAAVNSRVEALTGSLHERAESIRQPAAAAAGAAAGAADKATQAPRKRGRRAEDGDEDQDEAAEDYEYDDTDEEPEYDEEPEDDDEAEDDDDAEDEEEPEPEPAPRGTARRRAPVARARR
jgi:hypothetical protein